MASSSSQGWTWLNTPVEHIPLSRPDNPLIYASLSRSGPKLSRFLFVPVPLLTSRSCFILLQNTIQPPQYEHLGVTSSHEILETAMITNAFPINWRWISVNLYLHEGNHKEFLIWKVTSGCLCFSQLIYWLSSFQGSILDLKLSKDTESAQDPYKGGKWSWRWQKITSQHHSNTYSPEIEPAS